MASDDVQSAQRALDAAKQSHRNDPDQIMSRLHSDLAAAAPKMHTGGEVPADGVYELEAGEHVLTADQTDKIAPTAPEGSPEAGFAKINGSKKVRGATPKSSEPVDPDKFAAIGGKFVGKIPERAEEVRNAPLAEAPAVSSIPENSPFFDHAARVLNTHGQALDLGTKSDLWDAFAESRDSQTLATKLAHPNFDHVPNGVKHELYIAHAALMPAPSHADKVVSAINHLGKLASTPEGKQMLQVAEQHPNILRSLTSDKG